MLRTAPIWIAASLLLVLVLPVVSLGACRAKGVPAGSPSLTVNDKPSLADSEPAGPDLGRLEPQYLVALGRVIDVPAKTEKWTFDDAGIAAIASDKLHLYLVDAHGSLRAFRLSDGQELWTRAFPKPPTAFEAAGSVLITALADAITVYAADSGAVVASWTPKEGLGSVTVTTEKVVEPALAVLARDNSLVVYSIRSGELLGSAEVSGVGRTDPDLQPLIDLAHRRDGATDHVNEPIAPGTKAPTTQAKPLVFSIPGGFLVALEREDGTWLGRLDERGKALWSEVLQKRGLNDPTVAFLNASLVALRAAPWDKSTVVVDALDGHIVSSLQLNADAFVQSGQDLLLVAANEDGGLSLRRVDGSMVWRQQHLVDGWDNNHRLAALVNGELLVVTIFRGVDPAVDLFAVELASGRLRWRGRVENADIWQRIPFYQNSTTLEAVRDSLVLTVDQPKGLSIQVFDAASGRRWWSRAEHWK